MKKLILTPLFLLIILSTKATTHVIQVWDGYMQFLSNNITIELGDTVQWLPLDQPTMVHTITSTSIPTGAIAFDEIWQAPADTFFQYIPLVEGVYEYECTPHASFGMTGTINVISAASINELNNNKHKLGFPNPTINSLYFNTEEYGKAFQLYTINGNLVLTGEIKKEIDLSYLKKGIYFLVVIGDKPRFQKIIKQ